MIEEIITGVGEKPPHPQVDAASTAPRSLFPNVINEPPIAAKATHIPRPYKVTPR